MGKLATPLKRKKEIWTAVIYCVVVALTEMVFYASKRSTLDGFWPIFLIRIDLRLLFLPVASMICLLKSEEKTAFRFALTYAVLAVILFIVNLVVQPRFGKYAIDAYEKEAVQSFVIALVKAVLLILACKMTAKPLRIVSLVVYGACAVLNIVMLFTMHAQKGDGLVGELALIVLLAPTIVLWIYGLMPRQDKYTGLYRSSSVYSILRLMGVGACIVVGLMYVILAITLLGEYAALYSTLGVWMVILGGIATWLMAYMLMSQSE